jgi:hypothetical protein
LSDSIIIIKEFLERVGEEKMDGIRMDVYTHSKEGTNVLKALKLIVFRLRISHPMEVPTSLIAGV